MIDENSTFGGFLTNIGEAKQANANALQIPWKITHMLLGDASGNDPVPEPEQTELINQRYRTAINQLFVEPDNPAILIAELVLPPNVGGWWIRELGLEDEDGDLVAVANCAPSYKPLLAQGSGRNQVVRMHLILSNTANVELKIDPSVVLASRDYVDKAVEAHIASRAHPAGTTTEQGMLQLATSQQAREGTRQDRAVHPAGLKAAIEQHSYQFANYDPARTYATGETCRGSDGHFYEFYDRDLVGTVQGVDPANAANRPHIWMRWDGVRPATVIEWRSETLPEGYVTLIGDDISRNDYRRIWDAWGTTHGEGDGVATFGTPNDNDNFKRGWDFGASGRLLAEHQIDQMQQITAYFDIRSFTGGNNSTVQETSGAIERTPGPLTSNTLGTSGSIDNQERIIFNSANSPDARTGDSTYPRNNAVIYLAKI